MYSNKLKYVIFPLVVAVAVVAGMHIGRLSSRATSSVGSNSPRANTKSYADNKLVYTLSLIDRMYVDSVSIDSLAESVMPKLLAELDPHSSYIPASDFSGVNEALDGEFDGIGVVFNMTTDTVIVLNVIPGGPSDKAGIRNGDRIMMIDDSLVAGQKIPQVGIMKLLRGKRDTEVRLSISRQGVEKLVPITVVRGVVPIKSIGVAYMIKPGIGYVQLATFAKTSHAELDEALTRLKKEGMTGLIFDLRGNSGGFLDQAILIANDFLPEGKLIVYTEDRHKNRIEEYSDGTGKYSDIELIVLIDENSASSSEILAGAIQDNDRGEIIGRRSFGKGLVQQQIPFKDNSAIRLTIARYYTPTGRSIQRPYMMSGGEKYNQDFIDRVIHSELFSADSIKFDDSQQFTTPGGQTVYGGGGIMPDIFVPLDTSRMSKYFIAVSGGNILYRYTLDYSDRHRERMNTIKTVDDLNRFLDSDPRLLDDFVAYAARQGVKPDYAGIRHSKELIMAQLRGYIGRNTSLDDLGYTSQAYVVDKPVLRAIAEMEKK